MLASVFQCAAGDFTPDERIERLGAALDAQQVDLVVCPELFLSGYNVGDLLVSRAETADGPSAKRLAELARNRGTAIIYGYPERDGERIYNSASCIDRNGRRIAARRKLLLPPGFEADYFTSGGDGPAVFEVDGVRCAILICYESEFPESVRSVAKAGAEIVAVPTALAAQWHNVAYQLIPTRAFENGVWILYANHTGEEDSFFYLGGSCIIAPDGKDAARAGNEESLIRSHIDVARVGVAQARLPYLEDVEALCRKL